MDIVIKKLLWDDWNINHIKKHSIEVEEVESSLEDENVVFISGHSSRIMVLGKAGERLVSTILQHKKNNQYYVVTARDMAKKERVIYMQGKQNKEDDDEQDKI